MNQSIPPPPPGFTMIDPPDLSGGVPSPPPGFQVIGAQPPAMEWSDDWDVAKTAIEAMPEDKREAARKEWARAVVKRERAKGGIGQTVDDTVRRLARGIPVLGGLADEGNALIASGLGYDYDMQLAYERAKDAEGDEEAPMTSAVTQIAGGLATAPIAPFARGVTALRDIGLGAAQGGAYAAAHGFTTGEDGFANRLENAAVSVPAGVVLGGAIPVVTNSATAIRRGVANQGRAGAYGSVADDLQGGVDEFADQVAAGASRNNVATNRRTLDILGEEMERAGGNVPQAQQAAIARIAQETGVTPQTAAQQIRRLTQVHEGSDLLLAEYPSVAASDAAQRLRPAGNVDLDELGRFESTGLQGKLDYLANNGNAQSAHDVRNALALRQETLAPSMRETLGDMAPRVATGARGTRPATIEDTADLVETARRLAAQEYDAAYNTPVATPQRYQQIPRFFEYLANRAATSAPEVAATIRNAVNQVAVRRPDGSIGVQGLRQMQQGRTTIRGQIEALTRNGRADLANEIRPLYRLLTRTMEEMSPDWAVANRRWADMNLSQVAQDLGDAFATKAGPRFREQLAEFQHLAPEAQDIVRVHVLQKLSDKLDNLGDSHAVSKLFSNDASRNLIRQLFGNEAAVQFTRAVRNQKVAEVSQNMTRNSATHRRGVAQKQADAETGLVAAVENANVRGVRNWLLERMTQILTERKNRPMADILSTPMNDTANVARHIHNMRRQQDRLRTLEQPTNTSRNAIVSTTSQTGSAPGYADGGAVSLPRLKPSLMDDAAATSAWPEEEPEIFDQRIYKNGNRPKSAFSDAMRGGFAGFLDLGGATSKAARYLGADSIADWLTHDKDKAPIASFVGSIPTALPGVLYEAGEGVAETIDQHKNPPKPMPVAMTRDEFFQERRKPRETLEEAAARAEREFRASPTYIDLNKRNMVKVANRELSNAVERAKQTWRESQAGLADEEAAIGNDYEAYLDDINKQLEAEHSKGFSERNPWFKTAVGLGSIASGGLAAAGLGMIAKKGGKLLKAVDEAKKGGDAERILRAERALELWDKKRLGRQAMAVGLPATVPMDIRGAADVVDGYGLPQTYFDARGEIQPVLANERAREHLKPQNFIADSLPAIASGLVGAGLGAKFATKAPVDEVAATVRPLPAKAFDDLAEREVMNAAASGKIAKARQVLADERATLSSGSRVHARHLQDAEKAARRSPPAPGGQLPAQVQPQARSQPSAAGGGTTKALPSPTASKAVKNKLWDDVEAALKSGKSLDNIKAADYQGLTDKMLSARMLRVQNLLKTKKPQALGRLIKELRENDSWPLGVAGAAVGASAMTRDKEGTQ